MLRINILLLFLLWIINSNAQQFIDITSSSELDGSIDSNGVAISDYDNDGFLDVFIVARKKIDTEDPNTYSKLYRNTGSGNFEDVTENSGLNDFNYQITDQVDTRLLGNKSGASWADYNNDGFSDLFLTSSSNLNLFKNNGDGTFSEVTLSAGFEQFCEDCISTTALWLDINKDGFLDVFITDYGPRVANSLYINNQDETFSKLNDHEINNNISVSYSSIPIDVNNDGFLDIYVANDFDKDNYLFVNQSGNSFVEMANEYNMLNPFDGMGLATPDYNNDGNVDLFITNINENSFFRNNGDSTFTDIAENLGVFNTEWSWGVTFEDFNQDGFKDLYICNGHNGEFQTNKYFESELNYQDISYNLKNESFQNNPSTISKGVESFDYDNDGDLDIVVSNFEGAPLLYKNTISETLDNNWIKIQLQGQVSNRNGFGSLVRINSGNKNQFTSYHGSSFLSQSIKPIHFGIDTNSLVNEVEIIWPNGNSTLLNDIPANSFIKVFENGSYEYINAPELQPILGCTDETSCNYNPNATENDGTCYYLSDPEISGDTISEPHDTKIYTTNNNYNSYEWVVTNGHIVSGQYTNEIQIKWDVVTNGQVKLRIGNGTCFSQFNELDITLNIDSNNSKHSIARLWNEVLLTAIRNDYARPTVHARNLFHAGIAMFDSWAVYNQESDYYLLGKNLNNYYSNFNGFYPIKDQEIALIETISYAMYNLLKYRFQNSPGYEKTLAQMNSLMTILNLDPTLNNDDYSNGDAAALGVHLANEIIAYGQNDRSNELNDFENLYYSPLNEPLTPQIPGNNSLVNINSWQPLLLDVFIDQSGNVVSDSSPDFLSPEWGNVYPFSLKNTDINLKTRNGDKYKVYLDPGSPPMYGLGDVLENDFFKWGFSLVSIWGSHLDPNDNKLIDISPGAIGNLDILNFPETFNEYKTFYNLLEGGDNSNGRPLNPYTQQPYSSNVVKRGDYARVLAEFWADGPDSETPPGHWFTILNYVNDQPQLVKKIGGTGEILSDLEWDIKTYFTLGGAMHDAAIAAWSIKGWYDYVRPISVIRYMAQKGQSSDSTIANYHTDGLPLIENYIEIVNENDILSGENNEHVGKIKLRTWKGHNYIEDTFTDEAGVGWILGEEWWPYQRPSFVTPPFAGYVSGHSTFSRAAAQTLTLLTGTEYFPGGMGIFSAEKNKFLVFEQGPSETINLEWATYFDASDQCSLSRIWGGIHPPMDDIPGRIIGDTIGKKAFNLASSKFLETQSFNKSMIAVFPNPIDTSKELQISNIQNTDEISLLNLNGELISSLKPTSISPKLNKFVLPNVGKGIYILKILNSNNNAQHFKLVIQ